MFDPAAISLSSAGNPAAIASNAVMLENAGVTGDPAETPQAGGFEALLALQSAQTQTPLPSGIIATRLAAKAAAAAAAQTATGNILPDAAISLAAFAGGVAGTPGEPDEAGVAAKLEFMADPALLASIFAAPERLAFETTNKPQAASANVVTQALALPQPAPAQIMQDLAMAANVEPAANPAGAQPAVMAAVAMAKAAVIELEPGAAPVLPADAAENVPSPVNVAANLQARGAIPAIAAGQTHVAAIEPPAATPVPAPSKMVPEQSVTPELMTDIASPVMVRNADVAPLPEPAAPVRADPRAERVDFATLVETLNRAREDASPNTVRVSLAHADFGRVSMRFEQNDKGMTVAMNSADPGFARAVAASNEAASTATSSDNQRGQSSQANTNTGAGAQGENNRQPQSQRTGTGTPDRPAAQLRDTARREDEPDTSGGIFA